MERIEVMIGERVSLVVPEREDAKVWYKQMNDIENQVFLNQRGKIFLLEQEYDYYDSLKNQINRRMFGIMVKETGKIIGNLSLFDISEINRNAVLGVLLGDKTEQNKGYGTEALNLILKYGFEVLGLHKIKLEVLATNSRAKKVYEKVGFKEVGIFKEDIFDYEKYIDKIIMEIMRKDYFLN
ncbi:hypothetical protein DLH72_02580 [Candidatus Gracilibacteria bacterium]|nr:MAG: hypothetical protein DLH72_02580 [Candidatus Gracilibacteria bacterium]